MDQIRAALVEHETVIFDCFGKEIEVSGSTTLSELEEYFGFELDMLDIFSADWRVK